MDAQCNFRITAAPDKILEYESTAEMKFEQARSQSSQLMGFDRGSCLVFPASEMVMLWQTKMELNTPLELEVQLKKKKTIISTNLLILTL